MVNIYGLLVVFRDDATSNGGSVETHVCEQPDLQRTLDHLYGRDAVEITVVDQGTEMLPILTNVAIAYAEDIVMRESFGSALYCTKTPGSVRSLIIEYGLAADCASYDIQNVGQRLAETSHFAALAIIHGATNLLTVYQGDCVASGYEVANDYLEEMISTL
jgi:hypothetical protein